MCVAAYEEGLRQSQHFVLREEAVPVFVVEIEKPLDVLHQVVEHDSVKAGNKILIVKIRSQP